MDVCHKCKLEEATVFVDSKGNPVKQGVCEWCHERAVMDIRKGDWHRPGYTGPGRDPRPKRSQEEVDIQDWWNQQVGGWDD